MFSFLQQLHGLHEIEGVPLKALIDYDVRMYDERWQRTEGKGQSETPNKAGLTPRRESIRQTEREREFNQSSL
jgi:hypothetical protein